jgi:ribosomal protein S18 acetylase RimI-like enzyme
MDITIRPVRDEELDDVGELTAQAYLRDGLLTFGEDDPYLEQLRAARLRARHTEMLVAVDTASDALLGAVAFVGEGGRYAELAGPGEGEFRMLAVRPEGRGRGAGEALVRACVERARERGLRRLVMCSTGEMLTAHRLYRRLGFVHAPERTWEPYPGLPLHAFTLEL